MQMQRKDSKDDEETADTAESDDTKTAENTSTTDTETVTASIPATVTSTPVTEGGMMNEQDARVLGKLNACI